MAIYIIRCMDCQHVFKGMVFDGTREPKVWFCSKCGGRNAKPDCNQKSSQHPIEKNHGSRCPCCL